MSVLRWIAMACVTLMVSVSYACLAADIPVTPEPEWVKPIEILADEYGKKNTHSNGVAYDIVDFQSRYHGGDVTFYEHLVTRALNTSGVEEVAQVNIDYDPLYQKIKLHRVNIIRDGKSINMLDRTTTKLLQREEDLEYQIYDGAQTLNLIIEDVQVGDAVEYSVSIEGLNPVYKGHLSMINRVRWSVPVGKLQHRLIVPKDHNLVINNIATDIQPERVIRGNEVEYTWRVDKLAALVADKDYPSWYQPYGRVYVSDMTSWKDVVEWAMPMYGSVSTTPVMTEVVKQIEKEAGSNEEKILAALKYTQEEIRYLGIEMGERSHAPKMPDKVINQRFGDCKDKSRLLSSMLNAMGIDASPAFVRSSGGKMLDKLLPTPSVFDHVIVRVTHNGKHYWLDPTRTYQAGKLDYLYQRDFGYALVISEDNNVLQKVIDDDQVVHSKIVNEVFDLKNAYADTASYKIESIYKNYWADDMREEFSEVSHDEITKKYMDYVADNYPGASQVKEMKITDNLEMNVFSTIENYAIKNLWEKVEDNTSYVYSYFYPFLIRDEVTKPDSVIRTMPYSISHPVSFQHNTKIILPEGFEIENEVHEVKNDTFEFHKKVSFRNNVLSIQYSYRSKSDTVLAEDFKSFVDDVEEIRSLASYSLQMIIPEIGFGKFSFKQGDLNWPFILVVFVSLVVGIYITVRYVYPYDPGFIEPEEIHTNLIGLGGWMILPALGVILEPLGILFRSRESAYVFSNTQWQVILENYDQVTITAFLASELIFTALMFCMSIALLILMFQKRYTFPRLYITYLVATVVFMYADTIGIYFIVGEDSINAKDKGELIGGAINTVIWSLYMLKSKRVKSTFTNTMKSEKSLYEAAPS